MGESVTVALESASKALVYMGMAMLVGSCAARWCLLPLAHTPTAPDGAPHLYAGLARIGLVAARVALGASILRLWSHTAAAFDVAGAFAWDNLRLIGFESRWGAGWRAQAMAAALATLVWPAVAARPRRRRSWALASGAALLMAGTVPLLGHGAADGARTATHFAHVLGAGVWLGSLAAVVIATRTHEDRRADLLRAFSKLALPSAALVAVTGVSLSWQYVGTIANLVGTAYGQVLLGKLLLVAAVVACGFLNWRRWQSRNESQSDVLLWTEVSLAVLVLAATSLLTELDPSP
jgi:putative copper export protein